MRVTNSSILKYAKYLEYLQYLKYHYFCQRCTCYKLPSHYFFILEYFGLSSSTRDIATNQQVPPLTGPYLYPVPVSYSMLLSLLVMNRPQCESFVGFRYFWALVFVENLCISEASIHFPRQLLERSMRKRVTYRASPEYGLISIFHSVKNAYFITPHSQPISRNAKCSLVVPRPLRRVGLFLRE